MSGKGRDRSLPCVADAPDGFYGQILTITSAAIGTRPALLVGGAPVGSSRASQGSDRGAVAVRGQPARRSNHRIRSTVPKPMMGLSAMAAFATNHDWVTSMCVHCSLFVPEGQDIKSPSGARPIAAPGDLAFERGSGLDQRACRETRVVVKVRRSILEPGGLPQPWPRSPDALPRSLLRI